MAYTLCSMVAALLGAGGAARAQEVEGDYLNMSFTGDGGSNQGTTFEALNMAVVLKLPAIFVFENNQYGEGTGWSYAGGSPGSRTRPPISFHDVTLPVMVRANVAVIRRDTDTARQALAHLAELDRNSPDSWESVAHAHISADCELLDGESAQAVRAYGEAFRRALARGDLHQCATEAQGIAMSLAGLGRYDEARELPEEFTPANARGARTSPSEVSGSVD